MADGKKRSVGLPGRAKRPESQGLRSFWPDQLVLLGLSKF